MVMVDKSLEVDIGNTIPIGEVGFFIAEIGPYALEPSAGHCFQSCIHKSHLPWFSIVLMDLHTVFCDVKSDVTRLEKIICEVTLDDVASVSATDDEVLNSGGGIYLHDVPKYRLAADFNHRLWTEIALLTDSRAHTTGKNHGFHD